MLAKTSVITSLGSPPKLQEIHWNKIQNPSERGAARTVARLARSDLRALDV